MTTDLADHNIYDQVPYPNLSFTQTHPDRLATLATLLGMNPPPVERCRVLELGCAVGGNLIPMAQGLPESEFVGIDLSARQIAEGQATVSVLGLDNVTLERLNILDVGDDLGQFDYIIAHGVYAWVPRVVQDKILDICRQNLSSNGVAYVSYNTYPGWHMLKAIRDMMRYHTRQISEPQTRVTEARAFVDFLAKSVSTEDTPHSSFLNAYVNFYQHEIKRSRLKSDALLTHDELAEINDPLYFHQFAERVEDCGLQYLADANFQAMLVDNLPSDVSAALRQMAQNTIELEQYMDFLRNRTFRETLLCHREIQLNGSPRPECLANFYVASPALSVLPENERREDIHTNATTKFYAPGGAVLSTNHPVGDW